METMYAMVRDAVRQIPPQRLLRDGDREVIQRYRGRPLALGPEVVGALEEVLYGRLPEGAGAPRESLEYWWARIVTGPWDDDYLARVALVELMHVVKRVTNPMMLAASDHVVQLIADASVTFGIPDEERRALLDTVGRVTGTARVAIMWSHERAVSAALYEAARVPEGLPARLRDQEVGVFLERVRAELSLQRGATMRLQSDACTWLTDMDGVLVHEEQALPRAQELVSQWTRTETSSLVLTNNSIFTPRDLSARLRGSGLEVPEDHIWTSALATATFLEQQQPGASVYVIGEADTITALHEASFVLIGRNPDLVVIRETRTYSFESITRAIRSIDAGSRFIVTNPDATGPSNDGILPATGAIAALVSEATQKKPYVVGKPNLMMFRSALNRIDVHSEHTRMIGDRMGTDIVAGMEVGLHTVLVLTGITTRESAKKFPFRPSEIVEGVHELVEKDSTGGDGEER